MFDKSLLNWRYNHFMIYLGGVIQGSNKGENIDNQQYRKILKQFFSKKYSDLEVYCPNDDYELNRELFKSKSAYENFEYLLSMLKRAKYYVGYFPVASNGTAIELYVAYNLGIPTITISPMTTNWAIQAYSNYLFENIEEFISGADGIFS